MSTLVVEVCEVKAVHPHPNADALEFVTVKGWQVIVQKALALKPGDRVVYFPPDTVMPPELAERLGIAKYLARLPREIDGSRRPGLLGVLPTSSWTTEGSSGSPWSVRRRGTPGRSPRGDGRCRCGRRSLKPDVDVEGED
ncbi:hypothetical protein [Tautonia plasticadhaerens]|uniref:Uncharacterized protein n=1 Tax=Tautonia plasticadhaerens TaxID=2527974 RepID=A0A518H7X6_9BACT|nr:hypothetical protein [Tautonia plasticadhaerens]QDV36969.1 hypothetical protein ElP_49000 [Tautonia plasticadhaerens]